MSTADLKEDMASATTAKRPASPSPQHSVLPQLTAKDFDRVGKLGANIAIALEALWSNRLRSLLTSLGIFIGVAAVIAALVLTQSVTAQITSTLTSLGTNLITVSPGSSKRGGISLASGATPSLTQLDEKAIAKLPDVSQITPVVSVSAQVIYSRNNWNTRIQGVNPAYQTIENWTIDQGMWYSDTDDTSGKSVAVLGTTVVSNLFPDGENPIGKAIVINGQPYRVVGTLQSKGLGQDDTIFVPDVTAQARLKNSNYIDQIMVQTDSSNTIDSVQAAITSLLEQRHHIGKGASDDFSINNSAQLLQTASQFTSTLSVLLVGVAAISLTVGGVGIMNIMIVSVTERTREIGIRISIGAQRQDIRNQFLIEALTLSLIGGFIGMAIGLLIGFGVTNLIALPFVVTPTTLIMPFLISAGIGVVFGLYPAARAARLDPIDALRSL